MTPPPMVLELHLCLVTHVDARNALMHLYPASIHIHRVIPDPSLL